MIAENFWGKVHKSDTCWYWEGSINNCGYGQLYADGGMHLAHRIAYELERQTIPKGKVIDHLCRVRNCVNPYHLEAVTYKQNTFRGMGPASENARKTHCINGHALSGDNMKVYVIGKRACMNCKRDFARKYRERSKQIALTKEPK